LAKKDDEFNITLICRHKPPKYAQIPHKYYHYTQITYLFLNTKKALKTLKNAIVILVPEKNTKTRSTAEVLPHLTLKLSD
jgi:hypothetical protein